MKAFIKNPYTFFLSLLGYEERKPTPILSAMIRCTHNSWLKRIQDNGSIKNYEYNLYTN